MEKVCDNCGEVIKYSHEDIMQETINLWRPNDIAFTFKEPCIICPKCNGKTYLRTTKF